VRIALVKTSSMGDVIHALPVVSDIVAAQPGARVDWVVEESFADLPRLHPAVGDVIPVAVRRWRRAIGAAGTWAEIRAVRARLRDARYDLALDLQGLVKSAWIARWTGAPIAGFDFSSVRERLAALAYARRYAVPRDMHAIERVRALAAQALGYRTDGGPRFELAPARLDHPWLPSSPYLVLLHATSRAEKLWPEPQWVALGARLLGAGVSLVLPWGSTAEHEAAQRLALAMEASNEGAVEGMIDGSVHGAAKDGVAHADSSPRAARAVVAPGLSLRECASVFAGAQGVVGVDTGLTHLAAALERPTVALFAATDAWRFGPYWTPRALSLGADGEWPEAQEVLAALQRLGALPDLGAAPAAGGPAGPGDSTR